MKGIVKVINKNPIMGLFTPTIYTIFIVDSTGKEIPAKDFETVKTIVFFSPYTGEYRFKKDVTEKEYKTLAFSKNAGLYPYDFRQSYEAINHFDLFKNKQIIKYKNSYKGASYLKYTFGIEFESSLGCLPEDMCFMDGLIPLRDGSITAPEYSTVVMKGNEGLNLLYQQLEDLRKYTMFNKECALHIHFGGYPVQPQYILTLSTLWFFLGEDLRRYTNRWVYDTHKYKASGKSYCKHIQCFNSFETLYEYYVGRPFMGSLTQPHPNDATRDHKWNIHSRYYDMNIINMLCYNKAKTVEFRFLRPSYNFTKIVTWLYVLTAVLKYAELLTSKHGAVGETAFYELKNKNLIEDCFVSIVKEIYPEKLAAYINSNLHDIGLVSNLQYSNKDYIGENTSLEDSLMVNTYIK